MEVVIVVAVLALIAVALGVARDRGLSRRIGREVRKKDGDDSNSAVPRRHEDTWMRGTLRAAS